jgi:hypothetical protein
MSRRGLVLVGLSVVVVGCHSSVQINPAPNSRQADRWTAVLVSPQSLTGAVQIHGSAWMGPASASDSAHTLVSVSISNAAPGGVHPWSIHQGQCDSDQGVFDERAAYRALRVGGDGKAESAVTLNTPFPRSGLYYIRIDASSTNKDLVIACGNMAAPSRSAVLFRVEDRVADVLRRAQAKDGLATRDVVEHRAGQVG